MKTYLETIDYLYGLIRLGIRPGMRRINRLLSLIDTPQLSYPTIIVAGTNGKGSTSAALASILTEAGYRTGLYTSPHLERFNERIRVSGRNISDRDVVRTATLVRAASVRMGRSYGRPTFFETTTAMALEHFRRKQVDVAVLEVGMGGRLDATNVTDPVLSIITTIGVDHAAHLGKSPEEIAREKAGVIRPGSVVVTGVADPGPLAVIERAAREAGSGLLVLGRDFDCTVRRSSPSAALDYRGPCREINNLVFSLTGAHQARNAALAVAACHALSERGFELPVAAIRRGLKNARWPGRLELVGTSPAVLLDCAHNPDGASVLASALRERVKNRLVLVAGIMKDKDAAGIMAPILPMADIVIATAPKNPRSASPEAIASIAEGAGRETITRKTVAGAIREAFLRARPRDLICITGSIFTVGEARTYLKKRHRAKTTATPPGIKRSA